jgi:hypothetical protein
MAKDDDHIVHINPAPLPEPEPAWKVKQEEAGFTPWSTATPAWKVQQEEAGFLSTPRAISVKSNALILTSAEFVAGFVPPDYLIDGLLQKRYIYSMTAPTGRGKTSIVLTMALFVAFGWLLAGRETEKGKVLYFAGENPDDVRMRWIKLCEEYDIDPNVVDVCFLAGKPPLSDTMVRNQIVTEAIKLGPFDLIIVDTSAAYFEGDNENDNVQAGAHARMLRSLGQLPGGPTVLVTCHPTKNADSDNLLPRGGGAFLNEVDGNLIVSGETGSMAVEVHWHGKFRGVDFAPMPFELIKATSENLVDKKGRKIWTVFARPITAEQQEVIDTEVQDRHNRLLRLMLEKPGLSLAKLAETLRWFYSDGKPGKSLVYNVLKRLARRKLVEQDSSSDHWILTNKGEGVARGLPELPF